MKLYVVLIMISLGSVSSCAHVKPVAVDCGKEVSADILPAVESALVSQNYINELAKLVEKFGECAVKKGVEQITGEAQKDTSFAANDSNAKTKVEHGKSWLAAHPGP